MEEQIPQAVRDEMAANRAEYEAVKAWGGLSPEIQKWTEGEGATNRGKLNIYTCEKCRGHIVTRDIDAGVTPFMTSCVVTKTCGGMMKSSMYRVFDQNMRADHLWFRPHQIAPFNGWVREHLQKGGLILRPATNADAEA